MGFLNFPDLALALPYELNIGWRWRWRWRWRCHILLCFFGAGPVL